MHPARSLRKPATDVQLRQVFQEAIQNEIDNRRDILGHSLTHSLARSLTHASFKQQSRSCHAAVTWPSKQHLQSAKETVHRYIRSSNLQPPHSSLPYDTLPVLTWSMEHPISLQVLRRDHTSSKLPTFRQADIKARLLSTTGSTAKQNNALAAGWPESIITGQLAIAAKPAPAQALTSSDTTGNASQIKEEQVRNYSEPAAVADISPRPRPGPPVKARPVTLGIDTSQSHRWPATAPPTSQKARNVPASLGVSKRPRPPSAMSTPHNPYSSHPIETENPTEDWVVNQSALASSPADERKSHASESQPQQPSKPITTPLIPPIRGFKTSFNRGRKSVDANTSPLPSPMEQDENEMTLRGPDTFNLQRPSNREEEQSSDDSDLFLKLAREEASPRSGPIRRSQITSNRQSLPPNHSVFQNSQPQPRRRGSEQDSNTGSRGGEDQMSQTMGYRPSVRERVPNAVDTSRQRYYDRATHSTPTTPRALTNREISPESQVSYSGGRRPSIPDHIQPRASSYRQSNLSYSAPRTYNSSPLVSRTADVHDAPEVTRGAEGTESSVSTTAPSTVWDELEDLKSRIHRLELTGKLPTSSGAAISRASNERPPTATTTVTTMSSSPKRERGNSLSPIEAFEVEPDSHPLLSSALAKSKALLSPEVYSALEATAADALAIAAIMGSSGQPGPISSSQSTVGGGSNVLSDRQARRKADGMCRSLTELCLALSEGKSEQAPQPQAVMRPKSRDAESVVESTQRQPFSTDIARVKSSPRALSRLEARRSSLLATSALPSPRYAPSEVGTPTQSSMAGRRTSLLLRSRRAGTEEPEEDDDSRLRAPSRATTEVGRMRNSPREYQSQQTLADNRVQSVQSALPVRRHYASTSLTNTSAPPLSAAISNIAGRRYLDRSTPERDTVALGGKLPDERSQRKPSIGQGFIPLGRTGSLTRRVRLPNTGDH